MHDGCVSVVSISLRGFADDQIKSEQTSMHADLIRQMRFTRAVLSLQLDDDILVHSIARPFGCTAVGTCVFIFISFVS